MPSKTLLYVSLFLAPIAAALPFAGPEDPQPELLFAGFHATLDRSSPYLGATDFRRDQELHDVGRLVNRVLCEGEAEDHVAGVYTALENIYDEVHLLNAETVKYQWIWNDHQERWEYVCFNSTQFILDESTAQNPLLVTLEERVILR